MLTYPGPFYALATSERWAALKNNSQRRITASHACVHRSPSGLAVSCAGAVRTASTPCVSYRILLLPAHAKPCAI